MITILAAALAAACSAGAQEEGGLERDPRHAEVVNKLGSMRVSVDFQDMALEEALAFLSDFSGLNVVLDGEVTQKFSPDQLKVTLRVKDLLLKSCLKLLLNGRGLTATYREGVLLVVPKEKVDQAVTLQIYDVRDLLVKLQDFPGPKVELVSPTPQGGGPLVGGVFTLEEPKAVMSEDFILEMVKANTGDRSWEENPNASISLANGMLVVAQSKRVHAEVKRFLQLLRQFK
jgi:hypothetical protein